MLSIRVSKDVEERLSRLAELTGRSKSYYAREAIAAHIDELEDTYLGEHRLELLLSARDEAHPVAELAAEYDV